MQKWLVGKEDNVILGPGMYILIVLESQQMQN